MVNHLQCAAAALAGREALRSSHVSNNTLDKQVFDVMAVGVTKQKYDYQRMSLKDRPATDPEEVLLADRAQMNQAASMQNVGCSVGKNVSM